MLIYFVVLLWHEYSCEPVTQVYHILIQETLLLLRNHDAFVQYKMTWLTSKITSLRHMLPFGHSRSNPLGINGVFNKS